MKKVRFMLLAIAVIAIAGGTLAFKAKFETLICTDFATTHPTIANSYTCLVTAPGETPFTATCDVLNQVITDDFNPGDVPVCYTFPNEEGECPFVTGSNCGLIEIIRDEN